jgi:hypothetical protein
MFLLLTGCNLLNNSVSYKNTTKEFVEALLKEDYSKCTELMATEHETAKNVNLDTLKMGLANFRKIIIDNWGTKLEYTFAKSEKKFSTNKAKSTPPNTTQVLVEFTNDTDFGVLQVLFDDNSKKILNIKTLDIKAPIPSMIFFWLFGLFALCVPIFNIYIIREIKRSHLDNKWRKYLGVFLLNVPSIHYAAVSGLSFNLLNFQFLLGISFGYMGFLNSHWTVGIPLGGLYWLWKLKQKRSNDLESNIQTDESLDTLLANEINDPRPE